MREAFRLAAERVAGWVGTPGFFALNVAVVLAWLGWGLTFGFSDTLQLVLTTGLTVTTQLLVILVSATQRQQGRALDLKLAELLRAVEGARTELARAERLSEEEIERRIEEIQPDSAD